MKISQVNLVSWVLLYLEDLGSDSINSNPASSWRILQQHTASWTRAKSSQQPLETHWRIIIVKNLSAKWELTWIIPNVMSAVLGLLHCSGRPFFFHRPSCNSVLWGKCWIVNEWEGLWRYLGLNLSLCTANLNVNPVPSEIFQSALQNNHISMQT